MVVWSRQGLELAYDYAERVLLSLLGLSIIWRFLPSMADYPVDILLVTSECAAVVMIVIRRRAQQTDMSLGATLVALVGTTGALLVRPGGDPLIPDWAAALTMMVGFLLNIAAKVSLNRSFGITAANRGVKRHGPYRFMRHPMYAGYIMTQIAFLAFSPSLWNLVVYLITWSAQLLRIWTEERMLLQDSEYRAYASAVPFRLIPGVY